MKIVAAGAAAPAGARVGVSAGYDVHQWQVESLMRYFQCLMKCSL